LAEKETIFAAMQLSGLWIRAIPQSLSTVQGFKSAKSVLSRAMSRKPFNKDGRLIKLDYVLPEANGAW